MLARLYAPAPVLVGSVIELTCDEQHYLRDVLRARTGDTVQVFDGQGQRFAGLVSVISKSQVTVTIVAAGPAADAFAPAAAQAGRASVAITLVQAIASADKMDWTIEKATELGVQRIVPALSQRSLVRLSAERGRAKLAHWQRVALAACRQSGNDWLPHINEPVSMDRWLRDNIAAPAMPSLNGLSRLILTPPRPGLSITRLAQWQPQAMTASQTTAIQPPRVQLLVGPEAGLADDEIQLARDCGFECVSLGPRVLRTETAGLVAVAVLQARFGDL